MNFIKRIFYKYRMNRLLKTFRNAYNDYKKGLLPEEIYTSITDSIAKEVIDLAFDLGYIKIEYIVDDDKMEEKNTTKGKPKRDGSGKGVGANKGRGGCKEPTRKNKSSRARK